MMRLWKTFAVPMVYIVPTNSKHKNPEICSCIDVILTNKAKSFQSTCALETGSSDCYRKTISRIKVHFRKLAQVISYRGFKHLKMRGLWILYNQLLKVKITIMLKILTYFLTSVRRYLTTIHQEKKNVHSNNKSINQSFSRHFSSFYF